MIERKIETYFPYPYSVLTVRPIGAAAAISLSSLHSKYQTLLIQASLPALF